MPRAYSLDSSERLIDAVEAGSSARAVARRLQVSASTAVKWMQRKRETGSVGAKPMHGHPPAKLLPHKERLLRLVADEPDLTLRQIGARLAADGIHVSKSCLPRLQGRSSEGRARPSCRIFAALRLQTGSSSFSLAKPHPLEKRLPTPRSRTDRTSETS